MNYSNMKSIKKTFTEKCYVCGRSETDFSNMVGIKDEELASVFNQVKYAEDLKEICKNIEEYLNKLIQATHAYRESVGYKGVMDYTIAELKQGGQLSDKLVPQWRDVIEFAPEGTSDDAKISKLIHSLWDTREFFSKLARSPILSDDESRKILRLNKRILDDVQPKSTTNIGNVRSECESFTPYHWTLYFDASGSRLSATYSNNGELYNLRKPDGYFMEHEAVVRVTMSCTLCPLCTALINDAARVREPEPYDDDD
jgi:hypothetical protein